MAGDAFVHPTAEIEPGALVGEDTKIWRDAHVRAGAVVGSECVLGERVYIDTGVNVGDRVKIQNQAAVFGPAEIADGAFIGPGACLANDTRPRATNPDGSLKTAEDWDASVVSVGMGASIGAMATVLPGVVIGRWAMVGAGAVVTRDVGPHELVVGVPARFSGYACRCGSVLDGGLQCRCGRRYDLKDGELRSRGS